MFESILRDLLCEQGRKIEIWCSTGLGNSQKWEIAQHASPGNLQGFEELCQGNALDGSSAIVALKMAKEDNQRVLGIAVVDTSLFTLGLCEFVDDDQFSTLEAV